MRIRFAVAVLLLATVEHGSLAIAQGPGTFTRTGNMTTPRLGHTATLLPDGKVLIAGGYQNRVRAASASAELYDPSTCAFTVTGNMTMPRAGHTATLLPDGKVLIAGGVSTNVLAGKSALASAELYDLGRCAAKLCQ
jgi:hypothetical protein